MSSEIPEGSPSSPDLPRDSEALYAKFDEMLEGATIGSPELFAIHDNVRLGLFREYFENQRRRHRASRSKPQRRLLLFAPRTDETTGTTSGADIDISVATEFGDLNQEIAKRRDEVFGYDDAFNQVELLYGQLSAAETAQSIAQRLEPRLQEARRRPRSPQQ